MTSQNQEKWVLWESLKYKAATHSLFSDWKYCLVDTQKTVLFVWDILMNSSMIRAAVQGLQPGCHALRRPRTYQQTCICTEVGNFWETLDWLHRHDSLCMPNCSGFSRLAYIPCLLNLKEADSSPALPVASFEIPHVHIFGNQFYTLELTE